MSERQIFGFEYQKHFCKKHNLIENSNYTDEFDAFSKTGLKYQIKTYKAGNELMMADPFRYLKNNEDFILVIAERGDNDKIINETQLFIKNNKLKIFFEKNNFQKRAEFCKNLLNSITNNYSDDFYFKEQMKIEKRERKNSILNMQAKRDHKRQKRVQWSIPNRYIKAFCDCFEKYETRN